MAIKKRPKTTRKPRPVTNLTVDMYRDLFVLRQQPISEAFIERLGADLVEWATTDEDALVLIDFFSSRKIHPKTFTNWTKKHPKLKEALHIAKLIIGGRREKGGLKNKFNTSMVMSQQAKYDPSWWKLEDARAKLKAETTAKAQAAQDANKQYTIVLDSYKDEDDKPTDNMPKE